jgi:hypothetical protein
MLKLENLKERGTFVPRKEKEGAMLTLNDCIGFSGLTEEQLEAVAKHEHLPMILAAELVEDEVDTPEGCLHIESMITDEVVFEVKHGHPESAERYRHGLAEFINTHPHPER